MKNVSVHLPRPMRQFLIQSAAWTALCAITEVICWFFLHLGFPYNYPAIPPRYVFGDFRFWIPKFAFFHSPQFFRADSPLMYPAPVVVFYKLFSLGHFGIHAWFITLRFAVIIILASCIMLSMANRALVERGLSKKSARTFLVVTYFLSFPFWFELHVMNMEFIVWVAVTLGIWAFWTGKSLTASIFFGMAGAMKIFPFVFLGLFLIRKQYRYVASALAAAVGISLASLWLVCPDVVYSWRQTNAAVDLFRQNYMLKFLPIEIGFDHSLFGAFKRLTPTLPGPVTMGHILSAYLAIAAVGGVILFFVRIRKLPLVNQILCLSIAAILLPPTSFDYTLLHLYAPFILLVFVAIERMQAGSAESPWSGLSLSFFLLAFAFSTQSEFIYHGVRFAGTLKAVALLLLWLVALIYPFYSAKDKEVSELSQNQMSSRPQQTLLV